MTKKPEKVFCSNCGKKVENVQSFAQIDEIS